MARKRNKKQYSAEDKYIYHSKRKFDKNFSVEQRNYSDGWISGFFDNYAEHNVPVREKRLKSEKNKMDRGQRVVLAGQINGGKAALKNPEVARKWKNGNW